MTAQDAALDAPVAQAERPLARTHPFYWSMRRELWENRSIWIAPLVAAGVALGGMLVGASHIPAHASAQIAGASAKDIHDVASIPFVAVTAIVLITAFVTCFFYCLGALQGERRDRSILFWKSLPVSDLTTVAAKAVVALVLVPIAALVVCVAAELVVAAASLILLPMHGVSATWLLDQFPLLQNWANLVLILFCMSLWYAPVWGWCLVISGWAKRVAFLWAIGPPLALQVFERLAFGTNFVERIVRDRIGGGLSELFVARQSGPDSFSIDPDQFTPERFFSSPGLWIGLVVAILLFALAVWQRRYRSTI